MEVYLTDTIVIKENKIFCDDKLVKKHNWHIKLEELGWSKLHKQWISKLNNVGDIELDPKTALQQWIQSKRGGLPNYTDLKREGLDHDPIFYVEVKLENGLTATGKANSKRKAQQNAAQKLLSEIKNKND